MSQIRLMIVLAFLALSTIGGCTSNSLNNLPGAADAHEAALAALPSHPEGAGLPSSNPPPTDADPDPTVAVTCVSTVLSPEATKREISLGECVAIALENGRTGEFYDRGGNRAGSATGISRQGSASAFTDSLRVFAYDPAIVGTYIEESLAKFDAVWQTALIWNRFDEAPAINLGSVPPSTLGIFNPGVIATDVGGFVSEFGTLGATDLVQMRSELLKPLPTGGVAGITFRTDYENFQSAFRGPSGVPLIPGLINPTYRPAVDLTLEQPLLRGAGVFTNQLSDSLPASLLFPNLPVGGRAPGILLTRIAHDEAQTEFQRRVHDLLFAVEEAYWQLYGAYYDLYNREAGMKQTQAAWQIAKTRFATGGTTKEDLAQVEEQFHSFRKQRLAALGRGNPGQLGVLEAERRLRYVMGLPPEDGSRLIPTDKPRTTPFGPDWCTALSDALALRPELVQIRQDIQAAQLALAKANDLTRPDLRFIGRYNVNGLGQNLGSAVENFEDRGHHDWELGLLLQVPIGERAGHAEVTRARLQLSQRFALLRDQEAKVVFSLQRSYRDLVQFREEVHIARSQEQASAAQVQARYEKFKAGRESIDLLLRAQRDWVDALRDENVAVCNYNVALADYERQRGTIQQYENVTITEGPLPGCAQQRASEHIREWNRSLLLKEASPIAGDHWVAARSAKKADPVAEQRLPTEPLPALGMLEPRKDVPENHDPIVPALTEQSSPSPVNLPREDKPAPPHRASLLGIWD